MRFGGKGLYYADLRDEAHSIAARLYALGIRHGGIVGIALPRTPMLVAAVLGVLRVGAAYLPLDPEYPEDRIAYIVADAAVPVILTTSQLAGQFAASGAEIVLLDKPVDQHLPPPGADLGPEPGDLAYVLYTSGSTGNPKAVGVTHANVVNLICWARSILSDDDLSGILFSTSLNFDLSAFELFLPLCMGGRMILLQNLFALPRSADAAQVRLINSGPSLLDALLRTNGVPKGAKTVILAGERLPRSVADRLFAANPGLRLLNCYGPTETTVYSTCSEVDPDDRNEPHIGRAVSNTTLEVLDENGGRSPPCEVGELYIGGAGVSRGYIRRPDLDRERFVVALSGEGRMYRTGDLVRWRPDGQLDFLGRADEQLKINGLRVEPGEIEVVLEGVPGIAHAVVAMKRDEFGGGRLIGYLVGEPGIRTDLRDVRAGVSRQLPLHMRPVQYMWIERLPMTPNGKIDRNALPKPASVRVSRNDRQPETHLERALAEIWEDVLGLPAAGVSADFLESGGDSLTFLNLVAAIEVRLDVTLPMDEVFDRVLEDGVTIASLATAVMMANGDDSENLFLTVWQSFGEKAPLFFFPGIGGNALQMRLLARAMGHDRPLLIFHRQPNDDLSGGMEELASRCIELMLQRQPTGPFYLGGYSFGGSLVYEMARQLKTNGHDVAQVVVIDALCPAWRLSRTNTLSAMRRWFIKSVGFVRSRGNRGAGSLRQRAGHSWRLVRRRLADLPPEIATIVDPSTISPELGGLVEAHLQISFNYRKKMLSFPAVRVPVAIIRTTADSRYYLNAGPTMGWESVSDGSPLLHVVEGNHASIIRPPGVDMLAASVRACLNAVPVD